MHFLPETLASPHHLQTWWRELNVSYFRGTLHPIEIAWSPRLTSSAGMFVSRVGPRHPTSSAGNRLIRLSLPLLHSQLETEILSTLAHEMIHQWQFDVLRRRPNHGRDFCRKMREMNRRGLGVTIHHDLAEAVRALSKFAWRCTRCGHTYQRQRRTIRPRRHRCGACQGPLKEIAAHLVRPAQSPEPHGVPTPPPTIERSPCTRVVLSPPVQLSFTFETISSVS